MDVLLDKPINWEKNSTVVTKTTDLSINFLFNGLANATVTRPNDKTNFVVGTIIVVTADLLNPTPLDLVSIFKRFRFRLSDPHNFNQFLTFSSNSSFQTASCSRFLTY